MSKPIVNSRINYQNTYGRVIQHDLWLNQGVLNTSSPTFSNLQITGNTTIEGNLYVEGNTSILNTNIVEFKDNILLLNNDETGAGVTLHQAGLEIDRGSLESYRIVWNELNQRTEVGLISNLQPITLRQSVPLSNGIMIWNSSSNLIESRNNIDIPITFTSTVNSISSTTGALIVDGGVGIKKDIFINGKINLTGSNLPNYSTIYTDPATNSLTIISPQNINLTPNQRIIVPANIPIVFGTNTQYISGSSAGVMIGSSGDINLTPSINKRINIPNQIPLTFSSPTEQIYTDSNNNMVISGSQDIYLLPNSGNSGKKIVIPVNIPITFGTINQSIISNTNNDLIVNANNNILLNPGTGLNVKIPTNNGIIFGGSGLQRISADSNNNLFVSAQNDLYLDSDTHINILPNVPLTFHNYNQSIYGDTNGNLYITSQNQINSITKLYISNTTDTLCATTGSIRTDGGLGVSKNIVCESSIIINSQKSNALQVVNNSISTFQIDNSTNYSKVNIFSGDGTSSNPSLEISDSSLLNAQSLIQIKAAFDDTIGYMIGRGSVVTNGGRLFTINLPSYTAYTNLGNRPKFSIMSNNCSTELFSVESDTGNITSLGVFNISGTIDSTSPTTGAVVVQGGLGVVKSIYTSGKIITSVNSTTALQVQDQSNNVAFNIDTINNELTINQKTSIYTTSFNVNNTVFNINTLNNILNTSLQIISTNATQSTDTSSGSVILSGGIGIQKNLNVGGLSSFSSNIDMLNNKITNVTMPNTQFDVANKAYVDLVKQGLYVKDSVHVATIQSQNLNSDFTPGSVIDNYTLNFGDRILLLYQSNAVENGIYIVTNTIPTRSLDFANATAASGIFVFIKNGTINGSLGFICNSISPNDIIGTNNLSFTEFTGLGQVTPGIGLSKNFNEINVNIDNTSIEVNSNILRIKNTAVSTGLTGGSGSPLQTVSDQSHVTKLGTINTGTWNGSMINVPYGGTGKSSFASGNILFGNNNNPISVDSNFYYDSTNTRLGLGTNNPTKDIEINSVNTITILLNADSDSNNTNAKPEIKFSYNSSTYNGFLGMTRNYNEYASHIYNNALVLSNDQSNSSSIIQFATNKQAQVTILSNGNVGINTTVPNYTLDVSGTLNVYDLVTFESNLTSSSPTQGAVVITGGLSIASEDNSQNILNGGALTVGGGASIGKDLWIGGSINAVSASSNAFSYITITATDNAINGSTGCLVTFGGIVVQSNQDAQSVTNGGTFLTNGGASIKKSLYIGNTLYSLKDAYLGNLYFSSTTTANYIMSPNSNRDIESFLPINFTKYNNTAANILVLSDNKIILGDSVLQIGENINGYNLYYTSGNLNLIPNALSNNINIGTIGSYSDINLYGNSSGQITWQSTRSNLLLNNASIQFNKQDSTGSVFVTTPDNSGVSFIQANGGSMTLNLGQNSTGGQLTTVLSNNLGNSTITFTPSNITSSTLILTNNVYSTFNGPINTTDRIEYSGNSLHQTINNTSGNAMWVFMGQINTGGSESGYCEIDFNNGVDIQNNNISGLKLLVAINNTSCIASHQHYGNLLFNSSFKPIGYIYKDTSLNYQLFVLLSPRSQTNINVTTQRNTKFLLVPEGFSSSPNGTISNYNNTWTQEYITNIESTLKYTTGDLSVEGTTFKVSDNLPVIGYNNISTTSERDLGILYQRYQIANDTGLGDIVNPRDSQKFIDSLPSQTGIIVLNQLKLSSLASPVDDYYNGYWIKVITGSNINQVRQVIAYNGSLKVITIASNFTTQLPSIGDTIYFYNNGFVTNYFDSINNTFVLGYTNITTNSFINNTDNANLTLRSLYSTDTTPSSNSSSGSLKLLGGISINNTVDATSPTNGGTLTSNGGVGIQKNLLVGNNIGVGSSGFVPQESIHIRKTIASSRFENDTSSFSYIDFVENGTNNRYGILLDSSTNQFSLTNSNSNNNPFNSNRALTINNLGYIGINTTEMSSPLTLNNSNFISTNASTGYLGLIGANSNSNDNTVAARLLLFANNNSSGSLNLYAGNVSNGNVSIFTNNDIERLNINYNGSVTIKSTTISSNKTSGALIVNGGIGIVSTQNAISYTSGGSITTPGGVSIGKDLYIGGNIFINGSITSTSSITNPSLTIFSTTNCNTVQYSNVILLINGNYGILTFEFNVLPNNSNQETQVVFTLPSRSTNLLSRFEVNSNCSGYVDDTNLIPIMNMLSFGITGSNNIGIKFQSNTTSIHTFQLHATYIIA